ncbi:MAG: DUF5069 domain-containing protein [Nitrospirota bacterium]|nr:DUF5069 domain-containing protein [Nitrospirota bacterium]
MNHGSSHPPSPRSGRDQLFGIPWLARAIDKGRMALSGSLGDYVFPCPVDLEVLSFLSLSEEEFYRMLEDHPEEEGLLRALEGIAARLGPRERMWCDVFQVRYCRLMDAQDREEGRTNEVK